MEFQLPPQVKAFGLAHHNLVTAYDGARNLTLDGLLVGELGELIANIFFGVSLNNPGNAGYDGHWNNRFVQVKATCKKHITYTSVPELGQVPNDDNQPILIAMRINFQLGLANIVFNGPERIALTNRNGTPYQAGSRARVPLASLTARQPNDGPAIPLTAAGENAQIAC